MAEPCPACGFAQVDSERCPNCHVIVALHRSALEAMRRGPVRAPARPPGVPRVEPAAVAPVAVTAGLLPPNGRGASSVDARAPRPAPPRPAFASELHQLGFHGDGGTLFGMHVINVLLTLITLGVYRFWAKARVRRYMMSQTELEGDRFAWHGTGRELAIGFIKATVIFFVPMAGLRTLGALSGDPLIMRLTGTLSSLLVATFVPLAIVGVHRYRLSRTSYRGIRFSFTGRPWDFVKRFWRDSWLVSLTFGLYYPIFQFRRQEFLIAHSRFGQRRFSFVGEGKALLTPFIVSLVLTIPTFGLTWFWYSARKRRYFAECTSFGPANAAVRLRSTATGRELMNLVVGNALLLALTLGFAWPWIRVRTTRFNYQRLRLEGPLDLDAIVQEPQDAPATGDALAGLLGADFDLG